MNTIICILNILIFLCILEKKIYTNNKRKLSPPHDHNHVVGTSNYGDKQHVQDAIEAALKSKKELAKVKLAIKSSNFFKSRRSISWTISSKAKCSNNDCTK